MMMDRALDAVARRVKKSDRAHGIDTAQIPAEAALDGIYVLRTSVTGEHARCRRKGARLRRACLAVPSALTIDTWAVLLDTAQLVSEDNSGRNKAQSEIGNHGRQAWMPMDPAAGGS
jgi:hypothetical protein